MIIIVMANEIIIEQKLELHRSYEWNERIVV
jgi:hypothetical protein